MRCPQPMRWAHGTSASRAAELAVERARYDADRAERAFCACEPENRLVARSLEARWEARLAALAEAEPGLEAAAESLPPLPGRAELGKLAANSTCPRCGTPRQPATRTVNGCCACAHEAHCYIARIAGMDWRRCLWI